MFQVSRRVQLLLHVVGPLAACGDKGEIDLRLHHLRELDSWLFRRSFSRWQRPLVLAGDACSLLNRQSATRR